MLESLRLLVDTSDFPARWNCGNWSPAHGWVHILADLAIASAYAMIPLAIARYCWLKRSELAFPKILWLFAAFIFSCGSAHLVEAILFWFPMYRFAALLKVVTAIVSWATVITIVRIAPQALELPGLRRINDEQQQLVVSREAREALERSNRDLAQAEARLQEALAETHNLRAALDEHAIVAITDPQGKITFVNDKFCAISTYSRGELLGQDHRIINSGHHPKEFIRDLWTTIAKGKVWHGEIKNKAKDGSFYWVATTIVPFLDEHGKPRQYVAIRADITERKLAEEALTAAVKEVTDFKTALDEHAIVAATDPQGKITFVNDKFCAISKYSRAELIGQDHRLINSGHHSGEFIRDLWATITHGKVWQGEIKNRAKDGSFYWVATTIVPFLDDSGKPRQYVAIRADITEGKVAEEALRQTKERMRLATEASAVGIWEWNIASHEIRWDAQMFRIYGLAPTPDGFVDYDVWRNSVLPEDINLQEEILQETVRQVGDSSREFRIFRNSDGECRNIQAVERVSVDNQGRAEWVVGTNLDITERKQAEEANERARQRLSEAQRIGRMGDWEFNLATGAIIWSPQVFEILGRDPELGPPQSFEENAAIYESASAALMSEKVAAAIASGEAQDYELAVLQPGGQRVSVQARAVPRKDETGKVVALTGTVQDITQRKRAEAESTRLLQVLEATLNEIYIFDAQTLRFRYVNDCARRNLGYSMESMRALTPVDLKPEFSAATFNEIVGPLRRLETEKLNFQTVHRRADGGLYPVDVHLQLVERDGDAVFLAVINDISERKQAEQSIRDSEEYFRFLNDLVNATRELSEPEQILEVTSRMLGAHLNASRCAYADVASDGEQFKIRHDYTDGCSSTVGHYQLSLFGGNAMTTLRRGQTLVIRNVVEELLPDDGANMFNALGIQAIITCPLVKEGGLRAMMAVHQTTPRDWQPKEIALVQDVVERCWAMIERRTAEEEIHELNTRLEQRVMERTNQLEAANKELEAFSYSVSHDLRAPLRAVNGFARIVLDTYAPQLPAEAREYLEDICTGGEQMGQLIDDLLAFSRLSRQAMKSQPVETSRLVRIVLEELAAQREGRAFEIKIGDLPVCAGDPALLKQVWFNLISNAIKYTRERTPAVMEIGCQRIDGEDRFFVRDNGAGFDMRYVHKLFGVFQRLHRADEFEGTGVGLAIVQRIIHRHGGRVWAEAEAGRGALFQFTLN